MAGKQFQLNVMMDLVLRCARDLAKASKKQNKDFNEDQFTLDLQAMVLRYGNSDSIAAPGPLTPAPAPAYMLQVASVAKQSSDAIDLLVLSHDYYAQGKHKKAMEHFVLAMESSGADELIDVLDQLNNEGSEDEEEQPIDKVEETSEEEESTEVAADEDEDDEDKFTFEDSDEDDDDIEADSRLSQSVAAHRARKGSSEVARALANKVSLSGRRKQRTLAEKLIREDA